LPVSETAERVGLSSVSSSSRLLQKKTGQSPLAYRSHRVPK